MRQSYIVCTGGSKKRTCPSSTYCWFATSRQGEDCQ